MGREPAKRKRLRIGRRLDPNEIDEIIQKIKLFGLSINKLLFMKIKLVKGIAQESPLKYCDMILNSVM